MKKKKKIDKLIEKLNINLEKLIIDKDIKYCCWCQTGTLHHNRILVKAEHVSINSDSIRDPISGNTRNWVYGYCDGCWENLMNTKGERTLTFNKVEDDEVEYFLDKCRNKKFRRLIKEALEIYSGEKSEEYIIKEVKQVYAEEVVRDIIK